MHSSRGQMCFLCVWEGSDGSFVNFSCFGKAKEICGSVDIDAEDVELLVGWDGLQGALHEGAGARGCTGGARHDIET